MPMLLWTSKIILKCCTTNMFLNLSFGSFMSFVMHIVTTLSNMMDHDLRIMDILYRFWSVFQHFTLNTLLLTLEPRPLKWPHVVAINPFVLCIIKYLTHKLSRALVNLEHTCIKPAQNAEEHCKCH